jgi:SM-20-related protein
MSVNSPDSEAIFEAIVASLMDRDYAIYDGFLDVGACQGLLESLQQMHAEGLFKQASIGKGAERVQNGGIRGDEILWLEKDGTSPSILQFLEKIEALIAYCNRTCFTGIRDYESHFAIYPPGAYYHRHLDQFRQNGNRKFTFIFYLNFDWQPADGGVLRMYIDTEGTEKEIDISPSAGKLICFKSDVIPHEVLTTHATRYSITGWWLEREKQLSFL